MNLPVRFLMATTDDCEHDDDKDEQVEGGGGIDRTPAPGRLDQTGTINPSIAGHTKRPLSADVSHYLAEHTLLVTSPEGLQPLS